MDKYYNSGWFGVAMVMMLLYVFTNIVVVVGFLTVCLVIHSWRKDIEW